MKKLFNKKKMQNVYEKLQKNRKGIKTRAIFMIALLFGVNAFAWFVFVTQTNMSFDARVVAWDVNFFHDSTEVKDVVLDIGKISPGFGDAKVDSSRTPYKKQLLITNNGEIDADYTYRLRKFTIFGEEAFDLSKSNDEMIEFLKNGFPFTMVVSGEEKVLKPEENSTFDFELYWEYEAENKYYKLNKLYRFDPSVVYYSYSGGKYSVASVNVSSFSVLRDSLYVLKDDADSYFGERCAEYEKNTNKACVSLSFQMTVQQRNG